MATEREIDNTESELAQTQAEESACRTGPGIVVGAGRRPLGPVVEVAGLDRLSSSSHPLVLRVLGYFVLMPLVTRVHRPIHLAAGSEDARPHLRATAARRTLMVDLTDGEVLSARSEHVRPGAGAASVAACSTTGRRRSSASRRGSTG